MKIILGSSSKFRQEVMQELGYAFEIFAPNINEKAIRFSDPIRLVHALSLAKAEAIIKMVTKPAIIITSDQVVSYNGEIREKPVSEAQARKFLESYENYPIEYVNGIVVTNTKNHKKASGVSITTVITRPFTSEVIEAEIRKGDVFNVAGAIKLTNSLLSPFLIHMDGTVDGRRGLPKDLLKRLLKQVR